MTTVTNIRQFPGADDRLIPWLTERVPPLDGRSPAGMVALLDENLPGARPALKEIESLLCGHPNQGEILRSLWERILVAHTMMIEFGLPLPDVDPGEEILGTMRGVMRYWLDGTSEEAAVLDTLNRLDTLYDESE